MKIKRKSGQSIPVKDYIQEYVKLREEKKKIDDRLTKLANALKAYAEDKGQKDDKGSYYFERGGYVVGKQARKTISFDEEKAYKFFTRHGFPECIEEHTSYTINSDKVEELISSGDITVEDLESITNTKVSYFIDIKPVEEVTDEVEEHEVRGRRG